MDGPSSRPMAWLTALVLSVAFHAALVVALVGPARSPPRALSARARSEVIRVDVLGPPTGPTPTISPRPNRSPASIPAPLAGATVNARTPRPHGDAPSEPTPAQPDHLDTSPASASNEPPPAGRLPPDGTGEALTPREAPGGEAGAGGAERGALDGEPEPDLAHLLHEQLARAAEHCYPSAARRFRQVGVVSVSFCVTATGGVRDVELRGSSGVALLDSAATSCVLPRATPFPARAAPRCFEVPVRFGR